ncbi:hypothetical protein BC940DRAFT_63958 [Gongronella butleri]|nr:hypothetical protein BC940DRAFT_63958 [Gongronella butleri]
MLSCLHDDHAAPAVQDQAGDFATIFFNNVIACERKLRCSSTYKTINETVEEQEADQRPARFRSRSRSRSQSKGSRSRSTSITSFGKLFNRSRSQSPFSSSTSLLNKVIPTASKSTPSSDAANQPQAPAKRPRALSMTNDVRPSSGTGRRGSFQLKPSTSSSSTASNTRRKLSFDASYASNFFKFESKSTASTALASTITASPGKTPISTQKQQKDALPSRGASPGASSCSTTSSAASSTPSVFMQHQQQQPQALNPQRHRNSMSIFTTLRSHSPSPTAAVQPADLPPPAYLKPTSTANATSNKPSPTSFDTNKQRQLCDKLNTIFQSALKPTTTPMSATAAHRDVHQRRFSEAVLSSPTSMSTTSSVSSSPVSSSSPSLPAPGASPTSTYGTSSSSRSSFSNTFSSYASQSSRSSYSLEELDQLKPQGPYFHLLSTDMFANQQHDNSMLDDELAKKVITDKAASYRLPKSLAPRHDPDMLATASVTSSGSGSTVTPRTDLSRPATDPNSQFFIDKKAMLGNQIQRVSERLPQQHDAEVDILSDLYQDTMDEAVSLISKQRMELDEIQHILHAYRAQRQQQELASAPLRPVITDETPDALYKRKLREIEKERDYWHRRAR